MNKMMFVTIILLSFLYHLYGATGCELNDPDRDVKRFFPEYTNYKTSYVSIKSKGGATLLADIEKRLGDKFSGSYETMDVPYTMYTIYKNTDIIGYVHGVNQKGRYGGIQVFLATDKEGKIKQFYVQKMTAPNAKIWREGSFPGQFKTLDYNDFRDYNPSVPVSKYRMIKHQDKDDEEFNRILRAVKKNLILMDEFLWNRRYSK